MFSIWFSKINKLSNSQQLKNGCSDNDAMENATNVSKAFHDK